MKLLSTTLTILLLATPALAQSASEALPPQPQAGSMGELLNKVTQGWNIERAENQRRVGPWTDGRLVERRPSARASQHYQLFVG